MKIIAELGINTNGSVDRALRMVEAAKRCGCDGIKVQAYNVADFLPDGHPDWALFYDNRLTWKEIEEVAVKCAELDLLFGGTPTGLTGISFLVDLEADFLKNGSDFLLRHDLIDAMVATGIETWVATGMATRDELMALPRPNAYGPFFKTMACTSLYPCPPEEAGLDRLKWADGYSDHTIGSRAAVMACAMGAEMLEKHFTLDHGLDGPDHKWSANPSEMQALVNDVRLTESMFPYRAGDHVHRDEWRVTEGSLRP